MAKRVEREGKRYGEFGMLFKKLSKEDIWNPMRKPGGDG